MRRINNIITQDERNAIYVFGQPSRVGTICRLLLASELIEDEKDATMLTALADRLLEVSDEDWNQDFYTIKHRKEVIMNQMVLDWQEATGDMETARPWKPVAKAMIMSKFGSVDPTDTIIRLMLAEYVTIEPMIKDVLRELLDELCDERKGGRNYKALMKAAKEAHPYEIADDNEVYARIMKEGHYGKIQ